MTKLPKEGYRKQGNKTIHLKKRMTNESYRKGSGISLYTYCNEMLMTNNIELVPIDENTTNICQKCLEKREEKFQKVKDRYKKIEVEKVEVITDIELQEYNRILKAYNLRIEILYYKHSKQIIKLKRTDRLGAKILNNKQELENLVNNPENFVNN